MSSKRLARSGSLCREIRMSKPFIAFIRDVAFCRILPNVCSFAPLIGDKKGGFKLSIEDDGTLKAIDLYKNKEYLIK